MAPTHGGRLFTNQSAMTEADYDAYMRESYPGISSAALDYVTTTLYPAKYDGSLPYTTAVERLQVTVAESLFNCHCYGADRAYNTSAYDYTFAVPPGLHFQDTKYTFYNGPFPNVSETLAEDMQTYFTRFADKGSPNSDSALPYWPSFAEGEAGVLLKNEGISNGSKLDAAAVVRCLFWLSGDIFLENPASSVHHSDGSSKHVTGPL
ncbi:MAG: hypothetical protein M1833_002204 [Piccolia ochrophora]|nr:MAG: hypothetical protein M1833_002204 [Piccolia ochrophora]